MLFGTVKDQIFRDIIIYQVPLEADIQYGTRKGQIVVSDSLTIYTS